MAVSRRRAYTNIPDAILGALEEVFPGARTSAARCISTATCWEGFP